MEQRLGRGLDSLIARTVQSQSVASPQEIALADIRVNPNQPRRVIDDESLEGLAVSIQNHGVLQPIVVRRVEGGYELVAGERRFRATRIAGKTRIPATVVDAEGIRSLELALIENIQRENLSALDEAAAYRQLIVSTGMTHQELAERVGKRRATVSNALRLLELPDTVRDLMASGNLSAGQARALLGASKSDSIEQLAEEAVAKGWSVRDVEERVRGERPVAVRKGRRKKGGAETTAAGGSSLRNLKHYEDELRLRYGTRVRIHDKDGRGEIRLAFYSNKDRDRLLHFMLEQGESEAQ